MSAENVTNLLVLRNIESMSCNAHLTQVTDVWLRVTAYASKSILNFFFTILIWFFPVPDSGPDPVPTHFRCG